jgi:hypothetical protein
METQKKTTTQVATGALSAIRGALAAIPVGEVPLPTMPVDRMIGEGLALARSAKEHAEDLLAAGMEESLIDEVRLRASALAEAQAELVAVRGFKRTLAEVALEQQAMELRSDMIAAGRFALRDDTHAQNVLDRIQEGDGLDDLIQDLRALSVFFRDRKPALERIGAKPDTKRQQADQTASELESLLADRRAGDVDEIQAMDVRNRAAAYLAIAMAEVRATGVYVFRRHPRNATKFRSPYNNIRRGGRKPSPTPSAPEPENNAS